MNTNAIKQLYEKMPKGIKYLLAPVFIRTVTNNPIYKATYAELDQFQSLSEEEQAARQFELLKETLIAAYDSVPFYKQRFDSVGFDPRNMKAAEEITVIPLLTKDQAIEADESIYSTANISYFESFTGGSSGRALKVLLDQASIYKERAFANHNLARFGYDPLKSRTLAFWGHNKDDDYYYSPIKNEIVVSPFKLFDESRFETVWRGIEKFNPDFVAGYPSAIYQFAKLMERKGKHRKFKAVNFYAENYTDEMKEYIQRVMQCKAFANYGHTERAVFAEEYEQGYKFDKLYGYTEFLPTDTEGEYQIACTGFITRKMPLIRYVTDDIVTFDSEGYAHIKGHKFSEVTLISKAGEQIFKGAMTMHLDAFKNVKQYQYVQDEPGKAYLDLVCIQPLSETEKKDIIDYLTRRCEGLLDIEIREVQTLQLTRRGKYNWAVNNIKKAE